jgi:antitoxin VapB
MGAQCSSRLRPTGRKFSGREPIAGCRSPGSLRSASEALASSNACSKLASHASRALANDSLTTHSVWMPCTIWRICRALPFTVMILTRCAAVSTLTVRVQALGDEQAIRIPASMRVKGEWVAIRKVGDALIVDPVSRPSLLALIASWEPLDESFPDIDRGLLQLDDVSL